MAETPETAEPQPFERTSAEVAELIAGGARLIDVRTAHEHEAARLAGSERIGLEELTDRRDEISKDETVVFYCRVGNRSRMAAEAFSEAGYDAYNLAGGIVQWIEDGYVAEPGEAAAILEARARASKS
jgi:rhodanese-related sulfurtransferase